MAGAPEKCHLDTLTQRNSSSCSLTARRSSVTDIDAFYFVNSPGQPPRSGVPPNLAPGQSFGTRVDHADGRRERSRFDRPSFHLASRPSSEAPQAAQAHPVESEPARAFPFRGLVANRLITEEHVKPLAVGKSRPREPRFPDTPVLAAAKARKPRGRLQGKGGGIEPSWRGVFARLLSTTDEGSKALPNR